MPTTTMSRLPPPTSWDEFEYLCKSSFSLRWTNPNLDIHGRQGQKQCGVDIYGLDSSKKFVGIQCKNTTSTISRKLIEDEILKAEQFTPPLAALYIATTADRDVNIQNFARQLSEKRKTENKFPVSVVFWSDIVHDLSKDDAVIRQHFPQYFSFSSLTRDQLERQKDIDNISKLIEVIDFSSTCERLKWGPKYIHLSIFDQEENMNNVKQSPVFYLHDQDLLAGVNKLVGEWGDLCSLVRQAPYNISSNPNELIFPLPFDRPKNEEEGDLYEKINDQIKNLICSINSFCYLINTTYPYINLEHSSSKAKLLYS